MARSVAFFFAVLIAVAQAAPRPQQVSAGVPTQQTGANAGSSSSGSVPSGSVPSTSSNGGSSGTSAGASVTSTGTADSAGSITIIIPSDLFSSFFPSASDSGSSSSGASASGASSSGTSASGSSGNGGSASFNDPLTAIISIIPNAINQERNRIQTAVTGLVKDNVDAITDSINRAASTGGRVLSNGVKLAGAWPTFFGQLLG